MNESHGAPTARECASTETTVKWFDVTQSNPTEVVGMVKYEQGEDPLQWTETWYCYADLVRASSSHPTTRFTLSETSAPSEPPACAYIDTHIVTETPLTSFAAHPALMPDSMARLRQIDNGWYQLRSTDSPPEVWGKIHVTPGTSSRAVLGVLFLLLAMINLGFRRLC